MENCSSESSADEEEVFRNFYEEAVLIVQSEILPKKSSDRHPIGRHKIGEVPEKIASYLSLPNPKRYTGHCFRRTSATLLSDSGANMQMIKQLGRWRSDMIAQGYIENSMHNRQLIYDDIIQKDTSALSKPSTSTLVTIQYNTKWIYRKWFYYCKSKSNTNTSR
ncbi:uncharacterized protein LOC127276972 [Leptopilina boulardi]|uniref:uncharacterized protein LOC127276972 n=1 Tax=Leptopilina boulardi TaxID=63433 RepID=UPI0021F5C3CF|nr:uncharacterized protein LOC127276972 [Leptopilina boulardi]